MSQNKKGLQVREIAIFGMLGALMYASKVLMDVLPNIHLLGVFISAITIVYRKKALYPIYVFVFLTGMLNGFANWWIPYLYIWTVLWAMVMVLPQGKKKNGDMAEVDHGDVSMTRKQTWKRNLRPLMYMCVSAAHGFLYGTLYAPVQALLYGFSFKTTIAWIISGIPFDITHGISNFWCGLLILPLVSALRLAERQHS